MSDTQRHIPGTLMSDEGIMAFLSLSFKQAEEYCRKKDCRPVQAEGRLETPEEAVKRAKQQKAQKAYQDKIYGRKRMV